MPTELPKLATLQPDKNDPTFPTNHEAYIYEPKFDGIRTLVYFNGEDIKLVSRTEKNVDVSIKFRNAVTEQLKNTGCRNAIIDCELIAIDTEHLTGNFEALQNRKRYPCILQLRAFDVLYYNGVDIRGYSTMERKKVLAAKFDIKSVPFKLVPFADSVDGLPVYSNIEGHVAKQRKAKYESGRQRTWVKIKPFETEIVRVTGYIEGLGKFENNVGALNIEWIIVDPKTKEISTKDAGQVGSFHIDDSKRKEIWDKIQLMGEKFKPFFAEVYYLRKTAAGKIYHGVFLREVELDV